MASKHKKTQDNEEPSISRARIAEAAVELLDERGIRGLTMRRLAEHLGSGVMSLYWHVKNKEDVFDLALNAVLEYCPPTTPDAGDWRNNVLHLVEDWRTSMLRHPWSVSLLPSRMLGQNILDRLDLLGTILSSVGVEDDELNAAIWSIWNYVMGATITRASFEHAPKPPIQEDKLAAPTPPEHQRTIERSGLLEDDDWDGVFRKGLGFMLDGIVPRR